MHRFSFSDCPKLLICQCVQQHDAHLILHGPQDKVFENVLVTFVANIDGSVWNPMQKPIVKTLCDKIRNMLRARRSKNKANEASYGNLEVVSHFNQLLHNRIVANDDDETEKKKIRDDLRQRETTLMKRGESIRKMATKKETDDTSGNCDST